jgi:sec-independent protein translocase protein TatB
MFFDFGAGEIVGLAILAMILVGPERLPNIAVDAAKLIKRVRQMATTATEELKGNLGPGFEDLKPTDLSPKKFIQKQLAGVIDDEPISSSTKKSSKIDPDLL